LANNGIETERMNIVRSLKTSWRRVSATQKWPTFEPCRRGTRGRRTVYSSCSQTEVPSYYRSVHVKC